MPTMYDADAQELIIKVAEELKKVNEIKPPAWAPFVKTGVHKERPPVNADWWYIRAAAVLRTIYRLGPIGVSKLRTKYGGKENKGYKPEHHHKGSGNIIRKILQQLEKAGFVKQAQKGVHKGRIMTGKGKSFLDKIATKIAKGSKPEKKEELKEEKTAVKKEEKRETKKEEKKKEEAKAEKKEEKSEAKKEERKEASKEEKKPEAKKEEK